MALKMEKVAAIPAGPHAGIITQAHETTKVFDPSKGPEGVVEIVIQPKWNKPGHRTLPVSVVFSPNLTSLSALAGFLGRIGVNLEDGADFIPASLEGTEVAFTAETKKDGFVVVVKDTIRKA
jgi:hypothetical protein